MATRSEQYHADQQRLGHEKNAKRVGRSKPGVAPKNRSRAKGHAAKKATYALELTEKGKRPTRKSSRKSANRSKPDASLNRVEEQRKGSPDARFRKARARTLRSRGKGSKP